MVFEGDELRVGHVVDGERSSLLCGLQDHRHAAVRDKLDVQAEDEVFGVAQREGHAFGGLCGGGEDEEGGRQWINEGEGVKCLKKELQENTFIEHFFER